MKKILLLSLLSISLCVSCTDDILQDDVYHVQNSSVTGVYNGKSFTFDIERVEQLSVRHAGPFEIRRYVYRTAFIAVISSWTHQPYYRYLPFKFEAEEV